MKKMTGTVTGTKMAKTASVKVDRLWRHPIYKKIVTKSKTYLVHDEFGTKVGDKVIIKETRPQSKRKRWEIVNKIRLSHLSIREGERGTNSAGRISPGKPANTSKTVKTAPFATEKFPPARRIRQLAENGRSRDLLKSHANREETKKRKGNKT